MNICGRTPEIFQHTNRPEHFDSASFSSMINTTNPPSMSSSIIKARFRAMKDNCWKLGAKVRFLSQEAFYVPHDMSDDYAHPLIIDHNPGLEVITL